VALGAKGNFPWIKSRCFFGGGGRLDAAYTYIINVLTMEGAPQLLSKRYRGKGQPSLVSVQELNTTKMHI